MRQTRANAVGVAGHHEVAAGVELHGPHLRPAVEARELVAAGRVPHLRDPVREPGDDAPPVAAEVQVHDRPAPGRDQRELSPAVPHRKGAGGVAHRHPAPVGAQQRVVDPVGHSRRREPAIADAPQRCPTTRRGHDAPAVLAQSRAALRLAFAPETLDQSAGVRVPYAREPRTGGEDAAAAVGRGPDRRARAQHPSWTSGRAVPGACRPVVGAGQQLAAVRAELNGVDLARGAQRQLAVRAVPERDGPVGGRGGDAAAVGRELDVGHLGLRRAHQRGPARRRERASQGEDGLCRVWADVRGPQRETQARLGVAGDDRRVGLRRERLRLRELLAIDGLRPRHERDDGERRGHRERQQDPREQRPHPPRRRAPARGHVEDLVAGRRLAAPGRLVEPALGGAQVAAPQQVAAVAVVSQPLGGSLREPGVRIEPRLVELERRAQRVEVACRNPVRPPERDRQRHAVDRFEQRGNDPLVQRLRVLELLSADG